eukprot:scaffold7381_cov132-Isochrysis_galbana.AAC.7
MAPEPARSDDRVLAPRPISTYFGSSCNVSTEAARVCTVCVSGVEEDGGSEWGWRMADCGLTAGWRLAGCVSVSC